MTTESKEQEMNLAEMFGSIGFVGMCVMGCLLALSVYSVSVILDKLRRFRAAAHQSVAFLPEFGRCLKEGKLKEAVVTARHHDKSHVANVVSAGVAELIESRESVGDAGTQVELVSRALERSTALTLAEMKKGLGGLATIGSMAPFIGLFGTVVGIIHAFEGIADTGSGGVAAVSGGIAEALVATAFGILVAIPAVMGFNYFITSLERFQVEMNATSAELVDFLRKRIRTAHATQ
jgi:biopolymer transport protein ExbB/biopolymer transport protein TolQ